MDSSFAKKFSFEKADDWKLPASEIIYKDDLWLLKDSIVIKKELNSVKSLLNDKGSDWQKHTLNINKAGFVIKYIKNIIQPEILTQAWCKFYEILNVSNIVSFNESNFRSFHLCEAPGAFISALNYFLCLNHPSISWEWMANTLNPYYEGHNVRHVVVDDRFIFPTLNHWYFGKDNTGDITNLSYMQDMHECFNGENLVNLVTADGSVSCLDDPGEQELTVSQLQLAELFIGLSILAPSGCLVIKKFTFFECTTICQMYFLCCEFEEVHIFKPFTSKEGNSEVYVICKGFLRNKNSMLYSEYLFKAYTMESKAMFPKSSIPESFITQLLQCCTFFAELQKTAIKENLSLYSSKTHNEKYFNKLKVSHAELFLEKYPVYPLKDCKFQRLYKVKKQILPSYADKLNKNCKEMYFQAFGETFENIVKARAMLQKEIVLDVEKRTNVCFPQTNKRPLETRAWNSVWKEILDAMKHKINQNWIVVGKKFSKIENSKFCSPFILHLWNRISQISQLKEVPINANCLLYWDLDDVASLILDGEVLENCYLISVTLKSNCSENDPILSSLKTFLPNIQECHLNLELEKVPAASSKRIFFVNTSSWVFSLHQENLIKYDLTKLLYHLFKNLNEGDECLICIQSLLSRYTVGLFFIIISMFEKFLPILPYPSAPPTCGQIWIFQNYSKPPWTSRLLAYLEKVLEQNLEETFEILEIVPISSLCGGYFYNYILKHNNDHLLQRLRSLIVSEKRNLSL